MKFFSNFLQHKIILLIIIATLVPVSAYADNDDHGGSAQTFGWISIGTGVVANLLFVGFNALKKLPLVKVGMGNEIPKAGLYKPMLNFHIILNSVGFFAGMVHGIILIRWLDPISLSLAIVMIFSMVSGIILRFGDNRNIKFFGRLIHGQVVLSILLILLVILHVVTMDGSFD